MISLRRHPAPEGDQIIILVVSVSRPVIPSLAPQCRNRGLALVIPNAYRMLSEPVVFRQNTESRLNLHTIGAHSRPP